jgi:hypothetical protein
LISEPREQNAREAKTPEMASRSRIVLLDSSARTAELL